MSTTWVTAGSTSDLFERPSTTLKNFVINNWAETNPAAGEIRFLEDWWDGYGDYQIHFRESDTPIAVQGLGWRYRAYDDYVMVHVFARRNAAQEPPQRDNMVRELQRIVSLNRDQLTLGGLPGGGFTSAYTDRFVNTPGTGVKKSSQMQIVQINDEILTNAVFTVWHSMMRIRIHYWKVDLTP